MRINTRFTILIVIFSALMVLGTLSALGTIIIENTVMGECVRMNTLSAQLYRLKILTQDYIYTPTTRVQTQWAAQYGLINDSLVSPQGFWESRYQTPQEIFTAYSNIGKIFDQMVQKENNLEAGELEASSAVNFRKYTSAAIMTETEAIADWGNRLVNQSQDDFSLVVVTTNVFGMLTLVIIGIVSAFSFLNIRKIILGSILELKKGAVMVARGNLGYRIHLRRKDEFSELAGSFNLMASDLQSQYENLERTSLVLQMIDSFSDVLMRRGDQTNLLQESCRLVVKKGKYPFCWIGKAENDAGKTISLAAEGGAGFDNLQSLDLSWADSSGGEIIHPIARAIQTGKTILVSGAEAIAGIHPGWDHFATAGLNSMLILPLQSGEHAWGTFNIYANQRHDFIASEVVLLEDFASDLSYGLEAWSARVARARADEEVRKLNEELEQRVQMRTLELQVINNELDAFSYSVSHDLRAPLRAMDGFSEALQEQCASQLDDTGLGYVTRIRAAVQRMSQLIDALLRLSRVTRGELQLHEVDLSLLANEAVNELRLAQPERNVEIIIPERLMAQADANLMRIALGNLLSNAWKFTGKTSAARIELGRENIEGKTTYFVRDNGAGFDMAYAQKLFGAFQRLHSETEFEGSGIGLAMVRRIIQRHDGRVWAESENGHGATFYFTLG